MTHPFAGLWVAAFATLIYHLSSKTTPESANLFVVLIASYIGAIVLSIAALFLTRATGEVTPSIAKLNWTTVGLAIGIFGIELGYLLLYRSQMNVSLGMITVEAIVAMLLVPLGLFIFRERLTTGNLLGVVCTCVGLLLLTQKRW